MPHSSSASSLGRGAPTCLFPRRAWEGGGKGTRSTGTKGKETQRVRTRGIGKAKPRLIPTLRVGTTDETLCVQARRGAPTYPFPRRARERGGEGTQGTGTKGKETQRVRMRGIGNAKPRLVPTLRVGTTDGTLCVQARRGAPDSAFPRRAREREGNEERRGKGHRLQGYCSASAATTVSEAWRGKFPACWRAYSATLAAVCSAPTPPARQKRVPSRASKTPVT